MSAAEIDAILADFRAWLEAGGEPAPEPVGLLTLAREVTALRHEVNLQTKASRAAVEKLSEPPPPPDSRDVQRPLIESLVDIADALVTAHRQASQAASEPPPKPSARRLFRPPADAALRVWAETARARLAAIADGYALSLKRVERALTAAGLEPIQSVGERFDPTTMEAIGLGEGHDQPSGTVLSESRRGYRWGGEVFRFARVTVAR